MFSVFKVPKTTAQKPINGLGPWQEAMDVALKDTKLAAGLYSLPLNIDPDSLKIVVIEGRARLIFHVSTNKVKWLDNTSRTFGNDMPDKAKSLVTHSVASDTIMSWLGDGLSFLTKTHVDYFDVAPKSTQKVTKVLNIIGEYEGARAKQEALRGKIKKMMPEVQRIMSEFKKEHAKIQAELDERLGSLVASLPIDAAQDKSWAEFSKALGAMGKKDWEIVIGGLSKKILFVFEAWDIIQNAWVIGKGTIIYAEQYRILKNSLEPLAQKIKVANDTIINIEETMIAEILTRIKKMGVDTKKLQNYYTKQSHFQ